MTPAESWTVVGVGVFGGAYAITGAFAMSGRLVHYLHRVGWRGAAEAVVGGTYLAASAALTVVLAPLALVFSDKLEEAEQKLAEVVEKKAPKPEYAEQTSSDRRGRTIEIDFEAPIEESKRRIEEA